MEDTEDTLISSPKIEFIFDFAKNWIFALKMA